MCYTALRAACRLFGTTETCSHTPHPTQPNQNRWPSKGEVEVEGLVVRYRADLDPVLRNLSFRVPPRTKARRVCLV